LIDAEVFDSYFHYYASSACFMYIGIYL